MIKLPAYLTGFSSKSDGSASLRFATQELLPEDFGELQRNLNGYGFLLFKPNEITLEDLPHEQAEDKQKTPSKRQRAILFIIWKQLGKPSNDFENYYRQRMEMNIEKLKLELE